MIQAGPGSPEGVVPGNVGWLYTRLDSTGQLYQKASGTGTTGWSAVGGGGSAPIHQVTTTLTNAQIIALPTANVVLVASNLTGNQALIPVAAVVTSYFSAGTYTNDVGGLLYIGYDSPSPTVGLNPIVWDDLDQSGTSDGYWGVMGIRSIATDSPFTVPGSMVESGVQYLDVVLRLKTTAGTALTAGNAANTLNISLSYYTLNVSTGVFE